MKPIRPICRVFPVLALACLCSIAGWAADWPQWRCDAGRSAASSEELPGKLHLQWTRQYAPRVQAWDDPMTNDMITYDRLLEPVVAGDRMFVGFNDTDKVVALDVRTGGELWSFFTDGPVRLPVAAWQGKVYAGSDDGHLYCLAADTGKLLWKHRAGPTAHKTLGNGRVISMWPVRGGPVVRDGKVYYAAGIWPFLGIFIYALDAETGKVEWVNDRSGAIYALQPHGAPAFGTVAPQGALVATSDLLLVPGGRSLPAAFNRRDGMLWYYENSGVTGGKRHGGSLVMADESQYFTHTWARGVQAYRLKDTRPLEEVAYHGEPVLASDTFYVYGGLSTPKSTKPQNVLQAVGPRKWEMEVDAGGDLIKAGRRLYAAGKKELTAIDLPGEDGKPKIAWTLPVERQVMRLLAAGGRLFAITLDGRIMAFGETGGDGRMVREERQRSAQWKSEWFQKTSAAPDGYVLCYGGDDQNLMDAASFGRRIVVVDPDEARVDQLRRAFDAEGLYGSRISIHRGDAGSFKAPPYFAAAVLVGWALSAEYRQKERFDAAFRSARPYGGAIRLAPIAGSAPGAAAQPSRWEVRSGPPPGAADWTHQYGDIANTIKSNDSAVRLPLGVLWFGGNSNVDVLPRHGHGPPEQVAGGRLVIEGTNCLSARDVYTGRPLWKLDFRPEELGTFGVYYDETYSYNPLERSADQRHAPGANARGANYVLTPQHIYLAMRNMCRVLDAATSKTQQTIKMPPLDDDPAADWGFIGLTDDVLLGGWGFAHYSKRLEGKNERPSFYDLSASRGLVGFDRKTGKVLWKVKARHGFVHNGIVAGNGRVYCLDKLPASTETALAKAGKPKPAGYRIVALDSRTGQTLWEKSEDIFGTWLGYSAKHDILVLATDNNHDRLIPSRPGKGLAAYRGQDGSRRWTKPDLLYFGPCILLDDMIVPNVRSYTRSTGAVKLLDGSPVTVRNPLTGKEEPWTLSRAYGCNFIIASEHLLTYRSGSAAYYDLDAKAGTGSLGGFKSGCTSNLVVADGVLNAPEYTRTCLCTYQNQTSLALVHIPDLPMESWTANYGALNPKDFSAYVPVPVTERVRRVGINFGAPGDRMSADGTLWLEYPAVGGSSFDVPVAIEGGQRPTSAPNLRDPLGLRIPMELRQSELHTLRRHEGFVEGALPWVSASCLRNVKAVTINLDPGRPAAAAADEKAAPAYTVRLFFAELEGKQPGERVFDVSIQGQKVLLGFDPVREAGAANRGVMREFKRVRVPRTLRITFDPAAGSKAPPLICGAEAVEER